MSEGSASLQTTWKEQAIWSATAGALKARIERTRSLVLGLILSTAVVGALGLHLAADSPVARVAAIAGAVLAGTAGFMQVRSKESDWIARWTRARSASEALKEQVYRYATRTGAYGREDPDEALRAATKKIQDRVDDLRSEATVKSPRKDPPVKIDIGAYVRDRVEAQIDGFYLPRAAALVRSRKKWRSIQSLLLFASAILSALVAAGLYRGLGAWVAVLTTTAGAFGAHIEGSRFDRLAVGYRATATRLTMLRDEWTDGLSKEAPDQARTDDFVNRCEEAISVENQSWMAELSSVPKKP